MSAHITEVSCHSILGLRQFYNYMSSVNYCLIIGVFLAALCIHDILPFLYMFVFMFHIIFMFHADYIWNFVYLYGRIPMYSHLIHVFLFLYESTLLTNWNHSN